MKNIVKKYLHQNQLSDVIDDFEDIFQSHPNYPSLYAITDTLNSLSIENIAIKIPKEQIEELPSIFLAFYDDHLVLVNKSNEKISVENDAFEKKQVSYSDFLVRSIILFSFFFSASLLSTLSFFLFSNSFSSFLLLSVTYALTALTASIYFFSFSCSVFKPSLFWLLT